MNFQEFNLRFLMELNRYDKTLVHHGTGTTGTHPLLIKTILKSVKQDIKIYGLDKTIEHWQHFIE